jgi:hypothetical protein
MKHFFNILTNILLIDVGFSITQQEVQQMVNLVGGLLDNQLLDHFDIHSQDVVKDLDRHHCQRHDRLRQ